MHSKNVFWTTLVRNHSKRENERARDNEIALDSKERKGEHSALDTDHNRWFYQDGHFTPFYHLGIGDGSWIRCKTNRPFDYLWNAQEDPSVLSIK